MIIIPLALRLESYSSVFRYDLHVHSCASPDCQTAYGDLVTMCRRRGLKGIALTDHDTMDGYHELAAIWPHDELHLVPGCERTLANGAHIIGLFVQKPLSATGHEELIHEIQDQGGIVYLPHPFREYSGALGTTADLNETQRAWIVEHSDVIEIFNRKCTRAENEQALALVEEKSKAFAAGSDAHLPCEIGFACTVYPGMLSPRSYQPIEALAPPWKESEHYTAFRSGTKQSLIKRCAGAALEAVGLLDLGKSLYHHLQCHTRPNLQRYK
jgi:predicted metal-dependent phosphoesterase TrpH